MPTVEKVDLERFMGTWYVHLYSPIIVDHNAVNAIEHYHLQADGAIATTYQFRKESPEAKLRTFNPKGTIYNTTTNAEWRMQFIWPFKAPYLIIGLDEDYGGTVIAHPNRKYAWIMHRSPELDPERMDRHLEILRSNGFKPENLQVVVHQWQFEPERADYIQSLPQNAPYTYRE